MIEHSLSIDYIKELILDNISYVELNHLRCCSKDLQRIVSDYSEHKMFPYLKIIHFKIKYLNTSKLNNYLGAPYIIIYNYYHEIIKYSYLMMNKETNYLFQKLKTTLNTKKVVHFGYKYNFDGNHFKKEDKINKYSYTLFDIMCNIYLTNKGGFWSKDVIKTKNELDEIEFLQGTLLPLS